jgi:hypothetical protein
MPIHGFLVMMVIQFAVTVALTFLQPKPKLEQQRAKGLGDFQFPTATEDRMIPIVWGTMDIRGPNVTWYGDLRTTKVTKKVKTGMFSSKDLVTAIRYYIGIDLLLSYGRIDRVTRLEVSDKEAWTGSVSPSVTDNGALLFINNVTLLGGKNKGGGIQGNFRIYGGTEEQIRDPYLQGNLGANIPSMVDISHVVAEQTFVGESPNIGAYVWRVSRFPNALALTSNGHIVRGTAGTPTGIEDGDANPAEVIYEIMTNKIFGLDFEPAELDFASFVNAGNTLATEQNGWTQIIDHKIEALELLKEVLIQIDAFLYEDSAGKFTLKLARDDYTLSAQPLFDETNVIEVTQFTRSAWSQTQNDIAIGFADRTENYKDTTALAQDTANVRIQDAVLRADVNYPGVKHPETAAEIAARELRSLSFPMAQVKLSVNRDGASLVPGDVIRLTWPTLGLVEFPVRILDVALGTPAEGDVTLIGAQDIFQSAESATLMGTPQPSGWTPIDDAAVQSTIELVREAPAIMINMSDAFTGGDRTSSRAWALASPANSVQQDFEMWVDTDDGAGFLGPNGKSEHMTPNGTLLSPYPGDTGDIDTSTQLVMSNPINLVDGASGLIGSILVNRNAAEIRRGNNLALIEGATQDLDEIIGYELIIDNGNGTFSLQNVHRGLMDTVAHTHPVSSRVWFWSDEASALSSLTFGREQTDIDWKYLTQTSTDALELAEDTTPLAQTFDRRIARPHVPPNWEVTGDSGSGRVPSRVDVAFEVGPDHLAVTWEHRVFEFDDFVEDADTTTANVPNPLTPPKTIPPDQDTDIEYVLTFNHRYTAVQLRQEVLVSPAPGWLLYNWTDTLAQADTNEVGNFPLQMEMFARRKSGASLDPDLTSLQTAAGAFNCDILGGTLQSVDLDGSTEYLANTTTTAVWAANVWTVACTIRPDVNVGGSERELFFLSPAAATINRIAIGLTDDANGAPWFARVWNSAGTLIKDFEFGTYTSGTWTQIVVAWDGTDLICSQDGVAELTVKNTDISGAQTNTAQNIYIGADNVATAATMWQGLIHKIAMWDVELTSAPIDEIWNTGNTSAFNERAPGPLGFYLSPADLIHFWDFRKSADATLGQDYGVQAMQVNLHNISDQAVNVTAADLTSTVPT